MTLLLLGAGAIAAALGTRGAAIGFLAAAIVGGGSALPAAATWVAAIAAGLCLIGGSPRRLAIPALGAAAALGVGSARNSAVVLALWVLATAAAVLSRGASDDGRRWALTLCSADVPFVAALVWTVYRVGLEGWPQQLDTLGGVLLLATALLRAPLASGPADGAEEAGLLPVRTQSLVLVLVALGGHEVDATIVTTAVVAGSAGFALGGAAARPATRDAVQELSLLTLVVAMAQGGWGPPGWEWGALAAGTLIHSLRLRLGDQWFGALAGALYRGGAFGLPLLPVVVAALEGSAEAGDWEGAVMMLGLIVGLGARGSGPQAQPGFASVPSGRWAAWAGAGILGAAVAAGIWGPFLTIPRPPAGDTIGWPAAWAAIGVGGVGAVAGVLRGLRRGPALPAAGRPGPDRRHVVRWRDPRVPSGWAQPRVLVASLATLGAAAAVLWVIGVLRGFL